MKKAIIIGSGIAGIATAIRLVKKGYSVTVYEQNTYLGGKLHTVEKSGFRFDAGPSLFTMPQYVEALFDLHAIDIKPYLTYQKLEIQCQYFFEDGKQITAYADRQQWVNELAVKTGVLKSKLNAFLKQSAFIYHTTNKVFLENSLHKFSTYLRWSTFISILKLPFIGLFQSMHQHHKKLFNNPYLEQYFGRYATYNGSNPFVAPATLNVIPHLEHHYGAFIPNKGMHQINTALVGLAQKIGVQFQLNTKIDEILIKDNRAIGVGSGEKHHHADIVVSNMDVVPTYQKLMAQQKQPSKILAQERSSSALIFYWGIQKTFPQLDVHNILFSANYKQEFDSLFQQKTIDDDPTVYINITSKKVKADAPDGCENWFVMVNAPAIADQNWEKLIATTRKVVIEKINRMLSINLEALMLCEDILSPKDIEFNTGSFLGSLYGTSSNDRMAAFFRHPNQHQNIHGLYFCGGSVHPGGGIPLVLLSAKITSELIPNAKK